MTRKQEEFLESIRDNLISARDDLQTAEKDLEEAKENFFFTAIITFKSLLGDGQAIDLRTLNCYVKGYTVTSLMRTGDDIKISVINPNEEEIEILGSEELNDYEIFYLATFITNIALPDTVCQVNDDDIDEDDDYKEEDENVISQTKMIQFPIVTNNTIIDEDLFWLTVNKVNWKDLSKGDNSVAEGKKIIVDMGYSADQIKQLRDIYVKLHNELAKIIKADYSGHEFSKSDQKINDISDYIIALGDETYIDIFNGIEDLLPYVSSHSVLFSQCFG